MNQMAAPMTARELVGSKGSLRNIRRTMTTLHDSKIRVMSWNVLSDELAMPTETFTPFPHTDLSVLQWETRKTRILDIIRNADPDILCLVEVDHFADFFRPELEAMGYDGIFARKNRPMEDFNDGLALFWKADAFLKDLTDVIELCPSEPQIAMRTPLHHIASSKTVHVAHAHLKAKPGFEDRRLQQVRVLLSDLAEMAPDGDPVVVCGDFNDVPSSLACTEMVDDGYSCATSELPFTTWKTRATEVKRTIDYIWFLPDALSVLDAKVPVPDRVYRAGPFPTKEMPSDHVPLIATFAFNY